MSRNPEAMLFRKRCWFFWKKSPEKAFFSKKNKKNEKIIVFFVISWLYPLYKNEKIMHNSNKEASVIVCCFGELQSSSVVLMKNKMKYARFFISFSMTIFLTSSSWFQLFTTTECRMPWLIFNERESKWQKKNKVK